jgi:hypothetical protein
VREALSKSCARAGCHSFLDRHGDLDFSNLEGIAAQIVDRPATHGDIRCSAPGMPFRECTLEELPTLCPGSATGSALLVNTSNPEESWMLKKLRGQQGMCGDPMPLPPGNAAINGWNEERRVCIERFVYYLAQSGAGGMAGTGGTASAGMAGVSGSGGVVTGVGADYVPLCDLPSTLKQNCARTGCHGALDRHADLDFTDPNAVAAQLVDQVAPHGDLGCNPPGTPFAECTSNELAALGCPSDALLIDSANPEASWILRKLRGEQESCGDPMPIAPGNSISNGWNDARRACYEDWIYEMARFAREQAGSP